ncbi:M1-specific T cell receptor beta chain-like [Salvelinus fontinalis]|uniref:M1-specific T cell receptor beta chain-like n=1 Tax=Salvelinus fontinalis TaxID=8038 RepID=UPI002486C463|nr:M1-specific T cell receptor beta chain-like [Salvelinus fontinalis]
MSVRMKLLRVTLALLLAANFCGGVTVQQSPVQSVCREGDVSVTLWCYHDDSSYYYMFWYRQRDNNMEMLTYSQGQGVWEIQPPFEKDVHYTMSRPELTRSTLEIKNLEVGDGAVYYCASSNVNTNQAYFGSGTKLTVLDPNIKVTEPTVKVLPPSTKECEDRNKKKKKTLVCVATRFYPDHVTVYWQVNNVNTTAGAGTDNKALWDKDSLYSITSRLRVPANDWHNPKNSFTCNVIFFNGTGNTTEKHTIRGDLQGQIGGEITTDNYVKSTQTAKLAYSIFIAKSTFYGLVVMVMIWKFQGSSEKQI